MRIVLADDHALFRAGLRSALLEAFGAKTEVLEAVDFTALTAVLAAAGPLDLILCDLRMPDMDRLDGVAHLVALRPETPVVIVSASESAEDACRSLRQGAKGYILKSDSLAVLRHVLELILAGGVYAPALALVAVQAAVAEETAGPSQPSQDSAPQESLPPAVPALSNRQMMIFERLADGKPNKTIARELGIAEGTVKAQLRTVFRKLGVSNRTQAALFAAQVLGRDCTASAVEGAAPEDAAKAGGGGAEPAQARLHGKFKVFDFPS